MTGFDSFLNKIICGDALSELKKLPNDCIDLMACDPPYQLSSTTGGKSEKAKAGFMGKKWDVLPPVEVWAEVLRILKPGSFAMIMCTPRQDSLCEMIRRLSEAGFNTAFTSLYWAYASG